MFRTPIIAALDGRPAGRNRAGAAGQRAARRSVRYRAQRDYDDRDDDPTIAATVRRPPSASADQRAQRDRRRSSATATCSAAAMPPRAPATPRPGEAARDEQTRGTVGGTLGGAALGAIIGGASRQCRSRAPRSARARA